MRVLVTGATGYIGRFVAQRLVAEGHEVIGTIRDASRAPALPAGVTPLVADIADVGTMAQAALEADAILNVAFPGHGVDWAAAVAQEAALIEALVGALKGSGKTLVVSNGSLFLGDSGTSRLTEDTPVVAGHPAAIRADATRPVLEASADGVRGIELRLASFVYGHGGSVFIPALVRYARTSGEAAYVGDGTPRASVIHVEAAADAFVQALHLGRPGEIYNIACDEEPSILEIAEAVAIGTGAKAVSMSADKAAEALDPFTAWFLSTNNRLASLKARAELAWSPAGYTPLLWDVAHGSYAN